MRLRTSVAIALFGYLGQASAVHPDASWFERCQPSDGVGQALASGVSVSYFNPLPRDAGALFLGITLPPHTELRFAGSRFLAVPPGGDQSVELHPEVLTFKLEAVNEDTRLEFASSTRLANKSPREEKFALRLAENAQLPDQFTLLVPRMSVGGREQDSLAVHYRRFRPGGFAQVCGVNGITRATSPAAR